MKKTNLEQEETKSLHPGEEADSLHVQGLEVPHSAAVLYILSCNLCMQGWTIGFCQGGGHNISSLPARFLPPSAWGQSFNRGGQTFVTFIDYDLLICVVLPLHFF